MEQDLTCSRLLQNVHVFAWTLDREMHVQKRRPVLASEAGYNRRAEG